MNKRIVILGAGESGIGAALLAHKMGHEVFVSDAGNISEERKALLQKADISFEEGQHSTNLILNAAEVIKSPGIPEKTKIVKLLKEAGIPIIDELEFGFRYSKGKILAITGTNGKTTTTLLTYHLMKTAGLDVGLAGNVGQSWAMQLTERDHEWWVLEVSSFQIDGFRTFKPFVAILTNITPDHLDRYGYYFYNYIHAKLNLLANMDEEDHLIYYADDHNIQQGLEDLEPNIQMHGVSLKEKTDTFSHDAGDRLVLGNAGKGISLPKESIVLKGAHNMINVMCAAQAALLAGVSEVDLLIGLGNFENAPHRMEVVEEANGVTFINDSKGTNVDATSYALEAYSQPILWIAGGVDKGNNYEKLMASIAGKVKALICLGKDNEKLKKAFEGRIPLIMETQVLQEAVEWAWNQAKPGDLVLLSPACASFDLFKNYEDRGDQFKKAVRRILNVKAK
ncbi:UDP-N-acetylmuramoyl-L-alanine--D-glutamate ligase [Pararhodonellum marinum]|uniref:UDP-N-acetylmuramoyl-L-alanine--D-glutamate ligase n=1 Tax=Pararhodonellum marinum TaxID=2755358 RepID=UPI00188EAC7E|nr:UDP-N-acetylmuramoyl-L-alanine--D-glutamate ligase [Pararhodonellum marinum]